MMTSSFPHTHPPIAELVLMRHPDYFTEKKILIGGWVGGNDDVIIKVGIGYDDV